MLDIIDIVLCICLLSSLGLLAMILVNCKNNVREADGIAKGSGKS
jgi:hypothetical protein